MVGTGEDSQVVICISRVILSKVLGNNPCNGTFSRKIWIRNFVSFSACCRLGDKKCTPAGREVWRVVMVVYICVCTDGDYRPHHTNHDDQPAGPLMKAAHWVMEGRLCTWGPSKSPALSDLRSGVIIKLWSVGRLADNTSRREDWYFVR